MAKRSIDFSGMVEFRRAGVLMSVDMGQLNDQMIRELVIHGITQKVGDAAAGKKDDVKAATDAMQAVIDSLYKGEWGRTRGGSGVDETTRVQRLVAKDALFAKYGKDSPERAKFTDLSDEDQATFLDELFAKYETAMRPKVDARLAALQAERDARKAAKAVDVEIDL